jgi:hypothetical protein
MPSFHVTIHGPAIHLHGTEKEQCSSPTTAGSDLRLTGLDLSSVIFLEIDYVPQFLEERKFN